MPISAQAQSVHARSTVLDLHAHPPLKFVLWGRRFRRRHPIGGAWNPLAMAVDLPKIREGGVKVMLSAIYLLERGLLEDCTFLKVGSWLAPRRIRRCFDGDPFARTLELLDEFEAEVAVSKVEGQEVVRFAKSRTELDAILAEGKIALLHSIEGAHSVGSDTRNVKRLFERGVCLITLGHFYENRYVAPVDAIPPAQKFLGCFSKPKDLTKGLTPAGEQLIEAMVELGIVVDITHCTPPARQRAFDIVNRRRPVVFSHVGVSRFKPDPMNPTNEEIRAVADTGGVIGIIFMNHWLAEGEHKNGLDLIVATARHLKDKGGIDVVALGTDFDGFTDPPDDVTDPSEMPKVTDALLRAGFAEPEVEKILGGNALRALRDGWGRS